MFWKKQPEKKESSQPKAEKQSAAESPPPKTEKLASPRSVEELVGRQMVMDLKKDPDWVWQLKSVIRQRPGGAHRFDFRVFDEPQMTVKKVKVKDYTTLDSYLALITSQGWFDKVTMEVHFEGQVQMPAPIVEAAPAGGGVRIFTENEVWRKIVGLSEPGSSVFFYLAGSPASGGPLGRGAAVIELNPNYDGKKQKRYIVYTEDVQGEQLAGKRQKMFDSNSSKEITKWIKERHRSLIS